jgi:hypothetical protein
MTVVFGMPQSETDRFVSKPTGFNSQILCFLDQTDRFRANRPVYIVDLRYFLSKPAGLPQNRPVCLLPI